MNDSLASTLVLCDLDNLLLGEDGNLTQVVRDVLQLFSSRGGRLTVFSQRSPRAVSYTHLDVYKRQLQRSTNELFGTGLLQHHYVQDPCCSGQDHCPHPVPVSYTHLDVYKRQIINTAMNGGDPMTVQEPSASCTGSCSTCGGCH